MHDPFNKLLRKAARLLPLASLALASFSAAHAVTLTVPADYPTIQAALSAAQNGDTVLIADGTYTGPGNVDLNYDGKSLTVTSRNGPARTIIDCQGSAVNVHRGFYFYSGEANAVLRGLTIKNGYEVFVSGVSDSGLGGGVCVHNSNVTIQNCIITGNMGQDGGGGVYSVNKYGGTTTLTGCTITGNTANNAGGGVWTDNFNGKAALTDCTVTGNTTISGSGGGVYNSNGTGTTTLTGCAITANTASNGAGVYNSNGAGTTALTNCVIAGNTASNGTGYTRSNGNGGGVSNSNGGGTITLTNCTVTGNAESTGGSLYNYNSGISFGQSSVGTISLINCIFYGDAGSEVANDPQSASNAIVSYCDIQGGYVGTGNINADPLFVPPGGDFHLQPGSPCLGKGTAVGAPATDKDGAARPNPPSIGAYEYHSSNTHLLWTNPDGRVLLWNVNAAGQFTIVGVYGPYNDGPGTANWTATALATGPDGLSHILWNNPDGRVILWAVDGGGKFTITGVYGPYRDAPSSPSSVWKATALSVGPDNVPHILWTHPDGKALYWNVAADGTFSIVGAYGPYTDGPGTANWTATALATGPDGISHLLWNNPDGHMALWTLNGQGGFTPFFYGPYTDGSPNTPWTAMAVSIGADNVPHLLWMNTDGKALRWNVAGDGSFTIPGVYGPYTDGAPANLWRATSLATGAGGLSHLLWNNPDGRVALWTVNPDGTFTVIGGYGPYTDGSPGTPWTAAAVSANP